MKRNYQSVYQNFILQFLISVAAYRHLMIDQYNLIPSQAFLYFPSYEMTIQYSNQQKLRTIFSGNTCFDEDQMLKIEQLKKRIRKNNKNKYLEDYPNDFLLRSFQAAQFKLQDTINSLKDYHIWQKKTLPLIISPKTEQLLKTGILYVCGRDCYYRPIIVVNTKKVLDLKIEKEDLIQCLSYFFEFVIQNFLIEGQVEQWTIIIDLGNASVFSLGKSMLDIIVHLSSIFKVRAVQNFIINCPSSIKMIWSALKGALNEEQISKISMSQKKKLKPTNFNLINPSQVQQKYGGTYPNIEEYWPLHLNPNEISVESIDMSGQMITQNEYNEMFNNHKLKNKKIKKGFIKKYKNLKSKQTIELEMMTDLDQNEGSDNLDFDDDNRKSSNIGVRIPSQFIPKKIDTMNLVPIQFENLF